MKIKLTLSGSIVNGTPCFSADSLLAALYKVANTENLHPSYVEAIKNFAECIEETKTSLLEEAKK